MFLGVAFFMDLLVFLGVGGLLVFVYLVFLGFVFFSLFVYSHTYLYFWYCCLWFVGIFSGLLEVCWYL